MTGGVLYGAYPYQWGYGNDAQIPLWKPLGRMTNGKSAQQPSQSTRAHPSEFLTNLIPIPIPNHWGNAYPSSILNSIAQSSHIAAIQNMLLTGKYSDGALGSVPSALFIRNPGQPVGMDPLGINRGVMEFAFAVTANAANDLCYTCNSTCVSKNLFLSLVNYILNKYFEHMFLISGMHFLL